MDGIPKLRPIDAFPVEQDGKTLIYLKDPLNLATPIGISPVGYFILAHFDGSHSAVDIQAAYAKKFGSLLPTHELKMFVDMLDEHYFLQSERFEKHQNAVVQEFRRLPTRAAAHVGGVYQADPVELMKQLDGFFTAPQGPGLPDGQLQSPTPKAIVAPHIDFHRGGPGYAWAYKTLAQSQGADLYILLGTSHCSGRSPYILTLKDFETPLGLVETDREFIQRLRASSTEDYFADEYLHRGEHSLEFQVVFLKYIAQKRAALTGRPEKPFKIVPILVSSFHGSVVSQTPPEESAPIKNFLTSLRNLAAQDSREVCFVAGVDLAHVGRQFGDREPITEDFLKWVESEDRALVNRLEELDASGFFDAIAKDQDKRRICGFSPLYSLIHLLDGAQGKHLRYSQAFTPETGSAVTFTSVIFE
ncbi:MAG TPA: AmmeMemoRadiSam system protein B [Terriglobales bacterium]|jgi:AmmeMemoRadiSam system protein B|nr:AmmeMemoRadiSam system protein B [Terriglobales bacterium]